jgi:hypothetical protein
MILIIFVYFLKIMFIFSKGIQIHILSLYAHEKVLFLKFLEPDVYSAIRFLINGFSNF